MSKNDIEMSVAEFAAHAGTSRASVHRWIGNGKIPKERVLIVPKIIDQIRILVPKSELKEKKD